MLEYQVAFRPDQIAAAAFVAPQAVILGDVTIGDDSSVWYNAVLRGDCERIAVGRRTNIQDGSILHADLGIPCTIGNDVTIGHAAIVHGAAIADGVMIGMRATVMNRVSVGTGCLIAVGTLIPEGVHIPPNSVVMGAPGKIVREVTDKDRQLIQHAAQHYVEAARAYRQFFPAR